MPATLAVAPSPAQPSSVVSVVGSGFPNAKTRLLLDGVGATTNIFRPQKDGTFAVGITVAASARTQTLVAQQYSSSWKNVASASVAVAAPAPPAPPVSASIRAAFYYPWFPETWTVGGKHVAYTPTLGYYSSTAAATVDAHIRALDYAKVQVAIVSWWGSSSPYNARIPLLLDRIAAIGSPLKVAFYYESEGFGNPSQSQVATDLQYLKATYGGHPSTRQPLTVFVYNADDLTCAIADKWKAANTVGAYIDLKVFSGFAACPSQPNGWHQYAPVTRAQSVGSAFSISPGFWRADEASARLVRDPAAWKQNVRDMVASPQPWHLITTFNEWGEGTAVESAADWSSPSGFGTYLDALHTDGA